MNTALLPVNHPQGPYVHAVETSDVGSDEWYAAVNTLRHVAGLPTVGHKLTYDFWAALQARRRMGLNHAEHPSLGATV